MELQKYNINEGSLDAPKGLIDQTVNVLSPPQGKGLTVSISRDKLPWGMDFEEFVFAQLEKLKEAFNDFTEDGRHVLEIDGARCPVCRFNWSSPHGRLYQMMTMVEKNGNVVILTTSMTEPISKKQKEQINEMYLSFKHRIT